VRGGVKELILVAQDILNYGKEWKDYDLLQLSGIWRNRRQLLIRLLYLYPTEITDELLDFIEGEEKICKYSISIAALCRQGAQAYGQTRYTQGVHETHQTIRRKNTRNDFKDDFHRRLPFRDRETSVTSSILSKR